MYLYSALLCIAVHPKRFTIMCVCVCVCVWGGGSLLNHHQCAASTWMINKHECMNAWSSTNIVLHLYWRDYIAVSVCTGKENDQLLSDYYRETEEWMVQVHRPSPWHWLTLRRPRCHQRARYLPPSSSPSVCKCLWDHIRYNTIHVYLITH